jgi:AraC-like DNA-binding protein
VAASLAPDEVLAPAGPVLRRRPRRCELAAIVTTVWRTSVPEAASFVRVLPDAAVDLVYAGGRLFVAGADTRPSIDRMTAGPVLGLQLAPGAVAAVLGAPASATLNGRVDVSDLWGIDGRDLQDRLAGVADLRQASQLIEAALADRTRVARLDPLPGMLRATYARGDAVDRGDLGLGERQVRRRCVAAFGYPPGTLRRITRFQRFMAEVMSDDSAGLAALASRTGYADQSHLSEQVRDLSGLTPSELRRVASHPLAGTLV